MAAIVGLGVLVWFAATMLGVFVAGLGVGVAWAVIGLVVLAALAGRTRS